MIKVNKPRVSILKGKVKRRTIGFINILTIAKPIATIIAVKKPSICIPGRSREAINTAKPLTSRLRTIFIFSL